jgi:hypothetical protein
MRKLRVSREKYIKVPGVWLKKHPNLNLPHIATPFHNSYQTPEKP